MPRVQNNPNPNADRAQEIIDEARRRLAAAGGKPSQLQAMIQRVSNEFAMRDANMPRGSQQATEYQAYQQPNNMDAYIDQVLRMSGMMPPEAIATRDEDAPIPSAKPSIDEDVEEIADDETVEVAAEDTDADDSSSGLGNLLAAAGGAGGLYALARYLMSRYGRPSSTSVNADGTISNAASDMTDVNEDGRSVPAVQGSRNVTPGVETVEGEILPPDEPEIRDADFEEARSIEGPRKQLTGPEVSAIDQAIASTLGEGEQIQGIPSRGQPAQIEQQDPRLPTTDPRKMDAINHAVELLNSGDRANFSEALRTLRSVGIEPDENLMRYIAEQVNNRRMSLRSRVGEVAGDAVQGAIRRAVR